MDDEQELSKDRKTQFSEILIMEALVSTGVEGIQHAKRRILLRDVHVALSTNICNLGAFLFEKLKLES